MKKLAEKTDDNQIESVVQTISTLRVDREPKRNVNC